MANKDKLIDKALKFVQKGYIDKAIAEYQKVVEMDPSDVSIRLRLGDLYVKVNNNEGALKEYEEVAKGHTKKGFYLKAIAVYKQVLKLNESSLDVHNKLADLYAKQNLIADAISEYSYIANVFEKKGKTTDAFDLIKKMVDIDPENVGVKLKLADMHRKLGFDKDAFEEYCWIFEKLLGLGKLAIAEKILVDLSKENASEPRVLGGMVQLYKKKGDKDQFLKYAKLYAAASMEAGEEKKVRALCDAILKLSPDDEEALAIIGELDGETPAVEEVAEVEEVEEVAVAEVEEVAADLEPELPELIEDVEVAEPETEDEELVDVPFEDEDEGEMEVEVSEPIAEPELEAEPEPEPEPEQAPEEAEASEQDDIPVETSPVETSEDTGETEDDTEFEMDVEFPEEPPQPEEGGAEDEFVDLSKELGLDDALDDLAVSWSEGESKATAEEFKAGIGEQLGREDSETHYNLGIAYMEMELFDEAIREFKISLKSPGHEFDSYTRLGLCTMATGNADAAIAHFKRALEVEGRSDEERKGLMYELAMAYDAAGNSAEALSIFKEVHGMDPSYREVADKVEALGGSKGSEVPSDDDVVEVELS